MKENWEIKKLGEISECFIGITYKPDDVAEEGTIVLRSGNIQNSKLDLSNDIVRVKNVIPQKQIVRKNDILMCSRNGSLHLVGKCALIPDTNEKMTFGAFMTIIRSQFSSFLFHFFNSIFFREQLNTAQTTTVNQITLSKLTNIKIPIPPLPVQETIVKELDILHHLKELQEQQLAEYDNLAQSTFYSMFGDPIENEKGWEVRKLGEVAPVKSFKGNVQKINNKLWLLNLDVVEQQSGEILSINLVEESEINQSTVTFNEENVLYSKLRPYLNKVVIPHTSGYCTSELLPLLPQNDLLNRVFLTLLLRSQSFVQYIQEKTNGAKMPRVNMDEFRNFMLIIPPLSLQTDFAKRIEKIEAQKELVKQGITKRSC